MPKTRIVAPHRTKPEQVKLWATEDDKSLLRALAAHYGVSMSDVVTLLVRADARREGLLPPKPRR